MSNKKVAVVLGAAGFIGKHLVRHLSKRGYVVYGADLHHPNNCDADLFMVGDLTDVAFCKKVITKEVDEVYQLAADMGGAGYIFTGDNDARIMHNSALVNLNVVDVCNKLNIENVLYTSSACIYPEHNQTDPDSPTCEEHSAYPAAPDSEYGWEKLFSERLYLAYNRNHNTNYKIVRLHNIFGEDCAWNNGKEKSPAALCRKVAMADNGGTIDVWGDGEQTRSFLYIDECLEGFKRIMESDITEPINLGSEEMISINNLVSMLSIIAEKDISINHIDGPLGVRGRNSDNTLIENYLGWKPSQQLYTGMEKLYTWIIKQTKK